MSIKSSPSQKPLRLEIRPSRYFSVALIVLALSVSSAIFYSAIDWRVRVVCAAIVFAHLGLLLRRHHRCRGRLLWRDSGWLWIDGDRNEQLLELQSATLWPLLIALRFRASKTGKASVFTLLPDSFDITMQRRLRAYLRHMPVFAGTEAADGET